MSQLSSIARTGTFTAAIVVLGVLGGCGGGDSTDAGRDSGVGSVDASAQDAGVADSGGGRDAGPAHDAGGPLPGPPTIVSVEPPPGTPLSPGATEVQLLFSEPMASDNAAVPFLHREGGGNFRTGSRALVWEAGMTRARFEFDAAPESIEFTLSLFTDLDGERLTGMTTVEYTVVP